MKILSLTPGQFDDKSEEWKEGFLDTLDDPANCSCPYKLQTQERREWQDGNAECIEILNFIDTLITQ